MNFKPGDKVNFRNDPEKLVYIVYATYKKGWVSLGLLDYPDTEQDSQQRVDWLVKA